MKKILICLPLLLTGCVQTPPAKVQQPAIIEVAEQLTQQLLRYNSTMDPDTPLLVATPVLVEDMNSSNYLAAQLQQGLMTSVQQQGYRVVDLNLSNAVRVTASGDFLLTRDWKQLPVDVAVEHVLVSTISMARQGVVINSRIVTTAGNQVISAAQLYVPQTMLPDYLAPSVLVSSRNGLLYRDDAQGESRTRLVGETK